MHRWTRVLSRLLLIVTLLQIVPEARPWDTGLGAGVAQSASTAASSTKSFVVSPGKSSKLAFDGALLEIGAGAVAKKTTISITSLADTDLAALDEGMANTTLGPRAGYRFSPHNTRFNTTIRVSLPYNQDAIPTGLTAEDLKTFYFDDQAGSWKELQRVAIDTKAMVITSLTDHFTDMINAVVVAPDHPEPQSLNPNSMVDIKAADPSAGINLIQPPSPSNTGDAQVSYPIELPPGRAGMQPQLNVSYSSSGGNGWLGLGWELSVPAVSIDTRWGVPRYDAGLETETYTLNGEQLTPVAHRDAPEPRTPEKVFRSRVETQFRRIVRHGTGPASYWWEVTDKDGVRSYFGGTPATGPDSGATLRDGAGNIFRWALVEVRDLNGNGVRFAYDLVPDVGVAGGSVPGYQLYLRSINYTQSSGVPGAYTVTFRRDSQLPGYTRRPDVQIDARGGFKQVTAELLKRIEVTFNSQPVRAYDLGYQEGAFGKTLLRSITPVGADGTTLPPHEFTYFDEVRTAPATYEGFDPRETWNTGSDGVDWTTKTGSPADKLAGPLGDFLGFGGASALSGGVSDSVGGHLYLGFNPDAPTKAGSFGGKVGFGFSDSDTLLLLLDLNGDNLPDKVFKNHDGAAYFRLNESGPDGTTAFGPPIPLPSLPALSQESSLTWSFGAEFYKTYFNLLVNDAETFTTASVYVSDVNGDGLPDLVNGGTVLFNHLENGVPTFTANSGDTPVPIDPLAVDATGLVGDLSAVREEAIDNFPLVDTLRRWVAPFDGTVAITGTFRLVQDTSPGRAQYQTADGVRIAIQQNATEVFTQTIAATDYISKTPSGVDNISVSAGDRIYFRVGSVFDGKYDRVAWDPIIEYKGVSPQPDPNVPDVYKYRASQDFTLAGRRDISVQMPFAGTLRVAGTLQKLGVTTDDVNYRVLKNDIPVLSGTMSRDFIGTVTAFDPAPPSNLPPGFEVVKDDVVKLRLKVDSPIDVTQLRWTPYLFYSAVSDPAGTTVQDGDGNYIIRIDPPYDIDLYPATNLTEPQEPYLVQHDGTLTAVTQLLAVDPLANGTVTFTIKKPGTLLAKRTVTIENGVVFNNSVTIDVTKDDLLFFDYSAYDPELGGKLTNKTVLVHLDGDPSSTEQSAFHSATLPGLFPQPYRGWAYAGYNGNRDRATQPIDEGDLPAYLEKSSTYDPRTAKAYLFYPVPASDLWRGPDDLTNVGADYISSSRLGIDYIAVPTSASVAGAQAVSRLSRTSQIVAGAGLIIGPLNATGSTTVPGQGTNHNRLDYLDLNGDAFPDVVGNGRVQYTTATGGLEAQNRALAGVDPVRGGENSTSNFGVGGSAAHQRARANGQVDTTGNSAPRGEKTGSQMVTLGLSGSLGFGSSSELFDLMDVNGDGLPDRVAKNGDGLSCGANLCVALNLGYGFAPFEPWGDAPVGLGASRNFSLSGSPGLSFNPGFNGGLYDYAGGLSVDRNASQGGCTSVALDGACDSTAPLLVDVNGDGLLDRVRVGSSTLLVAFSTGSGFGPERTWNGALPNGAAKTANTGLGGGVYFTVAIPACLVACWVIINPGADFARNLARTETVIRDVDGDGYPDHLASTGDGSLTVARNRSGRTNLLKTIERPLGATIDLDYDRAGNTVDLPQSRWVLSRVVVDDGFAGDGADRQLTTFQYANGRYDRLEREFLGFASIAEEHRDTAAGDVLYRVIEHEFRNDSLYTKGLQTSELTKNGAGDPFVGVAYSYRFRDADAAPGSEPADPSSLLSSTTLPVFPELVRVERRFYESNATPVKSTYDEMAYDAFGNVSRSFLSGDAQTADDVHATIGYAVCPAASYIVGKAISITVTNASGAVLRQRDATIDCTTGTMTQLRQDIDGTDLAVTDLRYFPNGNLRQFIGPPNGKGQHYTLDYEYDPAVQTHVASITDSFGYSSAGTYDARFGRPLSTTDTNNNQTTYTYDAFGRVTTVTGPYEQGGPVPTIRFEYHPEVTTPWALTRHYDPYRDPSGVDTIDTAIFVDGLARVVQSKRDATVHTGPDAAPLDVVLVSGHLAFDPFGRTVEQRYPVTEPPGTLGIHNATVDAVPPTRTEYDVLDRATRLTIPDGTSTSTGYGFGLDREGFTRFEITYTDANGNQQKIYRDARALDTGVKQFNQGGSQEIWTSYRYDPLRQLTEIRDDKDHVTTLTYDNLGRRTAVDSPDSGKTETVYDRASNAVERITANLRAGGKKISYDYDFTRLVSIIYPDFPANNVTYSYGEPGAGANRAGRITRVTDQAGSEERFYGKLGEMTQETRTVVGSTGASPYTYTTQYVYDTFGRLQTLTYPDGEVLTYQYDAGGAVRQATGQKGGFSYTYMNRIEYDKFEQRAFVEAGNGVRTQYSYDPNNRRLANLRSGKPSGGQFQNLNYTYDNVGNVTALSNNLPIPAPSQFGGPTSQTFQYDDLYRLVGSAGTYQFAPDKTNRYGLTMTYDTIDNIRAKTQTNDVVQSSGVVIPQRKTTYSFAYDYEEPQPHAATHIDDRTFSYDGNGNETGWTNDLNGTRRTIVWDEENRVQSIFDNGQEQAYKYDDQGERVIKRGPQGETVYVNQYFTVRNGTIGTKHFYAGSARVASKLMKSVAEEKDRYFYHPDHLGSSNYVSDARGAAYEHLEYFPFGETWVQESTNTQRTPYLFTGKELDEETGLYYFGARYEDPRTSQFLATDPLLLSDPARAINTPADLAAYSYGRNNPLQYTDPDGRNPVIIVAYGRDHDSSAGDTGLKAVATALSAEIREALPNVTVQTIDIDIIQQRVQNLQHPREGTPADVIGVVPITHSGSYGLVITHLRNHSGNIAKGEAFWAGDFIKNLGLGSDSVVYFLGCRLGENLDKRTMPQGVRVFASLLTFYFSTKGEAAVDPLPEEQARKYPSLIPPIVKGKRPGAIELPEIGGPKGGVTATGALPSPGEPSPESVIGQLRQAYERWKVANEQQQGTQEKEKSRGQ